MKLILPDPAPLETAIAHVTALVTKIETTIAQHQSDTDAVAAFIDNGDPEDEEQLARIVPLRVRVEMTPNALNRRWQALREPARALDRATTEFANALVGSALSEREALLDKWEVILLPAAPRTLDPSAPAIGTARRVAAQLTLFRSFPADRDALKLPLLSGENNWPNPLYAPSVIERARAAIALREKIAERGTWVAEQFDHQGATAPRRSEAGATTA